MKCPVCMVEVSDNTSKCPNCGYSGIQTDFVSVADAKHWENTVLKQCRKIYETMTLKTTAIDDSCPTTSFDEPRRGCNVRIKDINTSDVFCGRIIWCDRHSIEVQIPGKLKALSFDLTLLKEQNAIEYFADDYLKRDKDMCEMLDLLKPIIEHEPYRKSYDAFIKSIINSHSWCFNDEVIYYNEIYQEANTYFCAYDNPPFEIVNTIVSKDGCKYTVKVTIRNMSKEKRNQPLKFRYKIGAPSLYSINDWTDTVTPAPKYQTAVISFEYDGAEKPYFEIIN